MTRALNNLSTVFLNDSYQGTCNTYKFVRESGFNPTIACAGVSYGPGVGERTAVIERSPLAGIGTNGNRKKGGLR